MRGVDVSNWQAGLDLASLPVDFAIVKATEGIGYTDPSCDVFVQQAINSVKCWGFYHFARENDPVSEAEWFVRETRNYFGHGVPVLDYETDNFNNCIWCERFIDRVHELTGVWCMLYISAYRVGQYDGSWITQNCGLWIAGYPASFTDWYDGSMPYSIGTWPFCAIWQFTSSLQLDGWTLDGDIAYMNADAWSRYAGAEQTSDKRVDDLACETILGEYGTGDERKRMLGERYDAVQARVNAYYNAADEVIAGKYGNGAERISGLESEGYRANIVQRIVNEILGSDLDGC